MSGLKVVVTGATGNIGWSLLESLRNDPDIESILGLARRSPQTTLSKVTWVQRDVASDDLTECLSSADALVHLAWMIQPTRNPLETWNANVLGSQRVFDAVAAARIPTLIYMSSVGAYSPGPKGHRVDEEWRTDGWPDAAYTREKAYVERALDAFELAHPQVRVARFRPGFVLQRVSASEQRRLFAGRFLPQRLLTPTFVPVVPELEGLCFQVVHAQDVAEAIRLALKGSAVGAFNLAAEPVVDVDLLAQIFKARPVRLPTAVARSALKTLWAAHVAPVPPGLFDAFLALPLLETRRARTELGWHPAWSTQEVFSDLLGGMAQLADAPTPPLART